MFEFNPTFDLSSLNGKNGFAIESDAYGDGPTLTYVDVHGQFVNTAGDVNGDGIADIIIGAPHASPGDRHHAGSSYVVFGKKGAWNALLELSALNGKNGFVINGVTAHDSSGYSVDTAGDVNGDGISDMIIGALSASPGDDVMLAGCSYVVFGKKTAWNASLELSELNGQNGFVMNGVGFGDRSGSSVSTAGDVNGDGIVDIIIGAPFASPGDRFHAGSSYVVFGKKTAWNAIFELSALDGKNGFSMSGVATEDFSGHSVSTVGDINGDGVSDVIIGAVTASPDDRESAGSSYVVFGKNSAWNASLELSALNGQNGFVINGIAKHDFTGSSVGTAGDVNADGIADIIIGAAEASPNGVRHAGSSYVVFGKKNAWDASLELSTLNGQNGFAANGTAANGYSGYSVGAAGDVNGDGIADVIIGTQGKHDIGCASYIVFGKQTAWDASLGLSALNGKNGFVIEGAEENVCAGKAVSTAGDINADGIADILIGAPSYGYNSLGSGYVVFGESSGPGFFSHRMPAASESPAVSANLGLKP